MSTKRLVRLFLSVVAVLVALSVFALAADNPQEAAVGKINLNTATLEVLMQLDGIGQSYAQRIIDYRETNGLFSHIEQVKNIKGIGEKTFEKIKDRITVEGATTKKVNP